MPPFENANELRVLHVVAPSPHGGMESVVAMLCEGQRDQGVHVAAILPAALVEGHPFTARLSRIGVRVSAVAARGRNYGQQYRQLRQLIRRLRPRVVHTHGYHADVIGGLAGRSARTPVVSTVHGFLGVPLRNWVYERVQLRALRYADALIAVSHSLIKRLTDAGIPAHKIHVVLNGFAARPVKPRAAARLELGIMANDLVVGWVGRLSREKGADVMLAALAASDSAWHLSIIGDGTERDRLRRQADSLGIGDRIRWHGEIANAGSVFSAFDAFVLSSRTEATPIVLLEAMNACVPIIATRVGGVADVVTSAHAMLVAPEQPRLIADALRELNEEPAAVRQRTAMAHERVVEQFGFNRWLQAVGDVYELVAPGGEQR